MGAISRRPELKLRSAAFTLASLLMLTAFVQAGAQNYPEKPIRVVVPWPAGGSNDIVARIVAQYVAGSIGQTLVIDNRGGAAGTIGTDVVAKSPPDGYTLLITSATHLGNAHLYKKLPYHPIKDFIGVSPLGRQVGIL